MRGTERTGFDTLSPNGVAVSVNGARTPTPPAVRPEPVEGPPFLSALLTRARTPLALAALASLSACAEQIPSAVQPEAPGFLLGLWHGFIFPVAWMLSLFLRDVAIYAVPNNGGWYDFGYFLGIVVFGVGARKSHVVYRERIIRVRG